jgi:hypothetical protein
MMMRNSKKLGIGLAAGLLVFSLASAPAQADHGHDVVAPAAALIALGWVLHHGHDRHYHYYKHQRHYKHHRHPGHHGHKSRQGGHYGGHYKQHRGHYKQPRRHSHSSGGYDKKRRHIRY